MDDLQYLAKKKDTRLNMVNKTHPVVKGRTYLGEGDTAPEGSEEQEGPRGGRYYEEGGGGEPSQGVIDSDRRAQAEDEAQADAHDAKPVSTHRKPEGGPLGSGVAQPGWATTEQDIPGDEGMPDLGEHDDLTNFTDAELADEHEHVSALAHAPKHTVGGSGMKQRYADRAAAAKKLMDYRDVDEDEDGEEADTGERPVAGHGDVQRMSDEELADHYKKLKDYVDSEGRAGKEVASAFYERGAEVEAELKRRKEERDQQDVDEAEEDEYDEGFLDPWPKSEEDV